MNFKDIKVYREKRFAIEKEIKTKRLFITFPVYNGLAEYTEFYEISNEELELFNQNEEKLFHFVDECKNRKHDQRLLLPPGKQRGEPC